jgi:Protein of unknown function (DUF1761)
MNSVRHNPLAIIVATILYFLLGGVWFTVFKQAWLLGVGRTTEELQAANISPAVTYGSAVATTLILAIFLSWLIQATGPQTLARGVTIAVATWFGVVFTTWATEYAFEARSLQIFFLNTGYCLTGMIIMGAVLGAWKKKA